MIQITIPELGIEYKEQPPMGKQLYLCVTITPVIVELEELEEWGVYTIAASSPEEAMGKFPEQMDVVHVMSVENLMRFASDNVLNIMPTVPRKDLIQ